jgi:hypothetical protein
VATTTNPIDISNLRRLATSEEPALAEHITAFLEQPDPQPETPPREGMLTIEQFLWLLSQAQNARTPDQRREKSNDAWKRYLAQIDPPPPPRFELADLMVKIYEGGSDTGRAALLGAAKKAPLVFGAWAGLKRIYKLAEARLDAQMFGALAYRFDVELTVSQKREVSRGTLIYLRRRAWRFLRDLGRSVPELYPQFAVEVLRHYEPDASFRELWVANHIWAHESGNYDGRSFHGQLPPGDMTKHRAHTDAWKRSPDPLMLLLETCASDPPAKFAIQGLRKDFPDKLRSVTPEWLGRLAHRPLGSAHEFLVETLLGSPEFHQGKLKGLGLHDAVLALLVSPSQKARQYAIEYARAHAQDLSKERLIELLDAGFKETEAFASAMLQSQKPRDLGFEFLGRLLAKESTQKWASKALTESFDRSEIPESFLIDMIYGEDEAQKRWASDYIKAKYQPNEIGAAFWRRALDDKRMKDDSDAVDIALEALGRFPIGEIGTTWLLDALTKSELARTVAKWLKKADALPGLDVERLKGFVFNAQTREVAFQVLGNPKLVTPKQLTLPWLLALTRRADPALHEFARRYLLEHMKPQDFSDAGDREAGIARLFALALGEKEPETMRSFAQTYLRCHHPVVGPEQAESKALDLKPSLPRKAYTAERIWPALFDRRDDVRKFAVAITRAELRAWGYHTRVYDLAESDAKEVRNIAFDALKKAGEPTADPAIALKPEEIDASRVFAMTESLKRTTRDVGMELILKHYGRLGGPERLGWLMQSADREVRLFAVRLLWQKHRPRALPAGWKPRGKETTVGGGAGGTGAQLGSPSGAPVVEARFEDVEALRGFLRYVLFGIPAGRAAEGVDDAAGRRRVPGSVAKRHVIEVVRDLGVEDEAFARLVAPVLTEFTGSIAKGEWQACLSSLMTLQKAHPGVTLEGAV